MKHLLIITLLLFVGCSFQGDISRTLSVDKTYSSFYVLDNVKSVAIDTNGAVWILIHEKTNGEITNKMLLSDKR